ncbi:hypothetical protein AGMMS49938_14240 [Fibrobacterales bacterium]|nr:hypothetical protein AGMMS49938_14240 [Fibrobacterales bacterium]
MDWNKAFDRRLDFIAKYCSLDIRVPLEKKKALHYLNQQKGCFHAFQYTNKILGLFIFLDEENDIDGALSLLSSDLKSLGDVLLRTSNPTNPFFLAIREEVPTWHTADSDDENADDAEVESDIEGNPQRLEITILRTEGGKDITDSEMKKTRNDLRKKLTSWKNELRIIAEVSADTDTIDGEEIEDEQLRLSLENAPLRIKSKRGELFVGFVPIEEIYNYHLELGRRHRAKHNMMIVSSNIRTYLGSQTHTNASLLDAFLGMEKSDTIEEFPFLHNGMTLTGDNLLSEQVSGKWFLSIDHPKIINGAQSLFTYEQYASRVDEPVNPLVLVKVVIPYPSENEEHDSGNFVRLVTMANNRQNPVFSYHLRAADDLQFFIWQKMQAEGFYYIYKEGVRPKTRTRKLEVRMRPELSKTMLLLDSKISESRASDQIFDQESLYQRCFGSFYRQTTEHESPFVQLCIIYTKAWQLLGRLPLKIKAVTPGQGTRIEPNKDNPLTRITWAGGKLEDKFAFRSAIRDVVVALALRYWLQYGKPFRDFKILQDNENEFNTSISRFIGRVVEGLLSKTMVAEYKDNPKHYDTISVIDNETGETVERRIYKGFVNTAVYTNILEKLCSADKEWNRCRGGLDDIWD